MSAAAALIWTSPPDERAQGCAWSFRGYRFALRGTEDRVPRVRDAVLVRPADDLGHFAEVEDRRGGAHLPLERERVPRVRLSHRAVPPRPDHVVEEDEGRGAEPEGGDRDHHV